MAHVAKIKQGAASPMVAHYEREAEIERGYRRENIDPERTRFNYNLRPTDVRQNVGLAIAQHEQTTGKRIRKDANVMFDWVVTLPKDCPAEKAGEFFEACVGFIERRYGKGNVLGAYVHMDETTPHVHVPVLPMKDGKLNMSKVVTRQDLRTFHGELGEAVDEALGFHVSVELDEQQKAEKALSAVPHEMLREATAGLDAQIAEKSERLERLRREVEQAELQPTAESLAESVGNLVRNRGAGERKEALAGEVAELRGRVAELEAEKRELGEGIPRLERDIERLRSRCERARARFETALEAVRSRLRDVRAVPDTLSRATLKAAREAGCRVLDRFNYDMEHARQAASAWSQSRGWSAQSRSPGRSR